MQQYLLAVSDKDGCARLERAGKFWMEQLANYDALYLNRLCLCMDIYFTVLMASR